MFDSKEFQADIEFNRKTRAAKLVPLQCFGFWSDICGFGSLLEKNEWNLQKMNDNHIMELQRNFYDMMGGIHAIEERTLILNDGIAKILKFSDYICINSDIIIFYLRDLLISHYAFWTRAKEFGVSVRSVLAAGEYIPYATNNQTGEVILQYDPDNISERGKEILNTTYVYNPTEFQMNTAFAKAFTIESQGKKAGIKPDYFYIESSTVDLINSIPNINFIKNEDKLLISYKQIPRMELQISKELNMNIKGLSVIVYEISKFHIFEALDGDDILTEFGVIEKNYE